MSSTSSPFAFFNNLRVSVKIAVGFLSVLAILAVSSVMNYFSLGNIEASFTGYSQRGNEVEIARDLQTNFLNVRRFLREFVLTGNEVNVPAYEQVAGAVQKTAARGLSEVKDPEQHARLVEIEKAFRTYVSVASEMIGLRRESTNIVTATLDPSGSKMRQVFEELYSTADLASNAKLAELAERGLVHVMNARLNINKMLARHDAASQQAAEAAFAALDTMLKQMSETSPNNQVAAAISELKSQSGRYQTGANHVAELNRQIDVMINTSAKAAGDSLDASVKAIVERAQAENGKYATETQSTLNSAISFTVILAVGGFVVGALLSWAIGNGIATPIVNITGAMQEFARGNCAVAIPGVGRRDEIGDMASALQVFGRTACENEHLRQQQEIAERQAREQRKSELLELAAHFEQSVGSIIAVVASASTELSTTAESLTDSAKNTSDRSTSVAAASEQASANVQTVANAAEELSGSVAEISSQVQHSSKMTSKAASEAARSSEQVRDLAQAAERIGGIVDLINNVASQTNLLALNATIEAARAGEAGRGFAVVAQEVKALAEQTAKATAQISDQITGIQNSTQQAITCIEGITKTINEVDTVATSITASVDQQRSATQEIARNIYEASNGTQEVARHITGVQKSAEMSSSSAGLVLSAARDLSQQSEALQSEMQKFLEKVRAA